MKVAMATILQICGFFCLSKSDFCIGRDSTFCSSSEKKLLAPFTLYCFYNEFGSTNVPHHFSLTQIVRYRLRKMLAGAAFSNMRLQKTLRRLMFVAFFLKYKFAVQSWSLDLVFCAPVKNVWQGRHFNTQARRCP